MEIFGVVILVLLVLKLGFDVRLVRVMVDKDVVVDIVNILVGVVVVKKDVEGLVLIENGYRFKDLGGLKFGK